MLTPPLPTSSQMDSANGKYPETDQRFRRERRWGISSVLLPVGTCTAVALPSQPQLLQVALLQGANSQDTSKPISLSPPVAQG